jgi:hypothetical protein
MDQAAQRVVSRSWLVSRRQSLRVGGSEHRTASGLLNRDFHLYERVDMGDHPIQVATVGGDAHKLSFSEGLQHPVEPTPRRIDTTRRPRMARRRG